MKRLIILALIAVLATSSLIAAGPTPVKTKSPVDRFSISLSPALRFITAGHFHDIYSQINIVLGADFTFKVSSHIDLFLHSDYLQAKGHLTYTKETTTLTVIPLELGLRFRFNGEKIIPYTGLAFGYYWFKEKNVIATFSSGQPGFAAEMGLYTQWGKSFFLDLKCRYSSFKIDASKPANQDKANYEIEKRALRSISLGVGFGILF